MSFYSSMILALDLQMRRYLFHFLSNPLNLPLATAKLILRLILRDEKVIKYVFKDLLGWRSFPFTYEGYLKQRELISRTNWKMLIILDACRYDYFKEECNLKGRLIPAVSEGSSTIEFVKETFPGKYEDIIYVSGNPFISNHEFEGWRGTDHFFRVENVWYYGFKRVGGVQTVDPSEVYKAAKRMLALYPEKRIIVHFMQPHRPFIGGEFGSLKINLMTLNRYRARMMWKLDTETLIRAYRTNLRLVLRWVKKLIEEIWGKVIITADHGNLLNPRLMALLADTHPSYLNHPDLRIVPWFETMGLAREKQETLRGRITNRERIRRKVHRLKKKFSAR